MIAGIAALAVAIALLVAAIERRGGRAIERAFRAHLAAELDASRLRTAQVELMLDAVRSNALEILTPADRDSHLLVSAPSLRAPGRAAAGPQSLELSVDALPEPLRSHVRAIEGDDVQLEYLETIQRGMAAGESADALTDRLFGE